MKYTFDVKLKSVKYYEKYGSYDYPKKIKAKKERKLYASQVRFWYSLYLKYGEEGLKHKENNNYYSPEDKFSLIAPILAETISIERQSKLVCIQTGTLFSWVSRYRKYGMDGLKCKKRGRPNKNMPKPKIEETKQEENIDDKARIKELEHKLLLAEFEIDYLKKVKALVEEKERLNQAKKLQSSTHSSKAKNTKGK